VDPVPDPLLLRKSGSAGNRTRDLCICSQKLWPLDHRGGLTAIIIYLILCPCFNHFICLYSVLLAVTCWFPSTHNNNNNNNNNNVNNNYNYNYYYYIRERKSNWNAWEKVKTRFDSEIYYYYYYYYYVG